MVILDDPARSMSILSHSEIPIAYRSDSTFAHAIFPNPENENERLGIYEWKKERNFIYTLLVRIFDKRVKEVRSL